MFATGKRRAGAVRSPDYAEPVLAAIDISSIVVLVTFGLLFALAQAVKRGSRRFRSSLQVRDGRVVMNDAARVKLSRHGRDLSKAEAFIAKNFSVNERGEIVERGEVIKATATASAPAVSDRPAEPETRFEAPVAENASGEIAAKTRRVADPPRTGLGPGRPLYRKPSTQDLLRGSKSSQGD